MDYSDSSGIYCMDMDLQPGYRPCKCSVEIFSSAGTSMDQQFQYSVVVSHYRDGMEKPWISALEKVPAELYEANSLDGANAWQRFRDVTLPCISPTTFFLLIVTMVNSLQAYDQIQILTQGGPSGSTRTLLYMYYQLGFEEYDMGQATAVAMVLVVITLILSGVQFLASKKWVHY